MYDIISRVPSNISKITIYIGHDTNYNRYTRWINKSIPCPCIYHDIIIYIRYRSRFRDDSVSRLNTKLIPGTGENLSIRNVLTINR